MAAATSFRPSSPTRSTADLGGLEKFKTDFAAAGVGQFGSGWAGCR